MATAQSYQAELPDTSVGVSTTMDVPDARSDNRLGTGSSIWAKIGKFFGGVDSEAAYQNALTEENRAYEQGLLREQRAYDEYVRNREYQREDTKMQRLIADYKAAGMNPWLAIQGNISGTSAQSQPVSATNNISGGSSAKAREDKSSSGALSGLLVAVAKVIASM